MKTEWWYDDASFHSSENTELYLARLTVREDGTAQLLLASGEVIELENDEQASLWLGSEEYRRLEDLLADFVEDGIAPDPRIRPPVGTSGEELLPQMAIRLGQVTGPPAPGQPDHIPTQA